MTNGKHFLLWGIVGVVVIGFWILRNRSQEVQPESLPFPQNIQALIEQEKQRQRLPGLAVAVVRSGKMQTFVIGEANWENGSLVSENTPFRLASVSKPLTAVATLQLWEQGKLSLDTAIQQYVPSFPEKQGKVTPRLLLGNLAGIRDYTGIEERYPQTHCEELRDGLAIFRDDPLTHEPGTKYLYSSFGFNLLGVVLEGATQKRYVQVVQDSILTPLGMADTTPDDSEHSKPHWAVGYYHNRGGALTEVPPYDGTCRIPGAGWRASIRDLGLFLQALLENRLLKPETQAMMWTEQTTRGGESTGYGLGWGIKTWNGQKVVLHHGSQPGANTQIWLLPAQKIGIAITTNLNEGDIERILTRLIPMVCTTDGN
jgi:CubicO group peptidase (beta-lactamase class C family)